MLPGRAALVSLMLALAACGSDSVTNPLFEPEVANLADNFQFQATAVSHITQTVTYNWQNSGTTANVDQSGSITGGTATLRIRDAGGSVVYTGDLTSTGSFTSSAGTSGTWTIQLVLADVSGNLNFRVQKP
ncbi:MAG TPA: hypothetical protein VFZ24_10375 [Longimicrobiales bacterium]